MDEAEVIRRIAVWALPVLFAITVHEVAHGWVARMLGDPTAMMLGRLTLNPIKHIDPIGTVLLPGLLLFLGGFIFGWARPVPVTWENLRNPKRDIALVAAAGPLANLLMALGWVLLMRLGALVLVDFPWFAEPLIHMAVAGIYINLILLFLNLLPIPPLDGGRVLSSLLPGRLAIRFMRLEPYGLVILLALLALGVLGNLLFPVIDSAASTLQKLGGFSGAVLDAMGAL